MAQDKYLFGFHAVERFIRMHPENVLEVFVSRSRQDQRLSKLVDLVHAEGLHLVPVEPDRLDRMAGDQHQGVVARIKPVPQSHSLDDLLDRLGEPPLLLLLDHVQDPHNLGACFRVADAMGVHAVITPKDRAATLNATARKVASGAADTVPWFAVTNLVRTIRELKERDILIAGTAGEETATSLERAPLAGPLAVVLGNEGEGMRRLTREACDLMVKIPMHGFVESLNVSVACGIVLYEARRQRLLSR